MSVRILSAAISGIEAQLIEVETDSTPGLHAFTIVGLADKAVEESKDRIGSAIRNSDLLPPSSKNKRIIINLAPADLRKEGPSYDLPIAVGYLYETGQLAFNSSNCLITGELSLDGSLKSINGVLAMTLLAKNLGLKEIVVPFSNIQEASVIRDIDVIGARNIMEVVGHLNRTAVIEPTPVAARNKNADDNLKNTF